MKTRARTVVLARETGAHEPAHQLRAGAPGERPGDVVLHRPRRLADEHEALPGAAAEHGVRARQVAGVDAAHAGAVVALDRA